MGPKGLRHISTGSSRLAVNFPNPDRPRRRRRFRGIAVTATGVMLVAGITAVPALSAQAATPSSRLVTATQSQSPHHDSHKYGLGWQRSRTLTVWAGNNPDGSQDNYKFSTHRLRAGLVKLDLRNIGTFPHQAQLFKLHKGVTAASYLASLKATGGATALALADATGGANTVDPGNHQITWINLRAGNYVVVCFQQGGDNGAPHFADGMYASLTVFGHGNQAKPPGQVQGTIAAYTQEATSSGPMVMGFHMPKVIDDDGLYMFKNTAAADTHELAFLKLAPGMTAKDVVAFFNPGWVGAPPFIGDFGGAGALAPGGHSWLRMNLKPGQYVAVCFVPDDMAPHMPHVAMGMAQQFTVS
jgi:hypothetical protein